MTSHPILFHFVYSDSARQYPREKLGNTYHFAMIRKRKGRLINRILPNSEIPATQKNLARKLQPNSFVILSKAKDPGAPNI